MFAAAGPYLPAMQGYLDRVVAQFGSDTAQTAEQVASVDPLGVLQAEPARPAGPDPVPGGSSWRSWA